MELLRVKALENVEVTDLIQYTLFALNGHTQKLKDSIQELKMSHAEDVDSSIVMTTYGSHFYGGFESHKYLDHAPILFIQGKSIKQNISGFREDGFVNFEKTTIKSIMNEGTNFPSVSPQIVETILTLVIQEDLVQIMLSNQELNESRTTKNIIKNINTIYNQFKLDSTLPVKNEEIKNKMKI